MAENKVIEDKERRGSRKSHSAEDEERRGSRKSPCAEDEDTVIERTDCCDFLIRKLFPQVDHFCWCRDVNLRFPVLSIAYGLGFAHLVLLVWNYILLSGYLHVGETDDSFLGTFVDPMFYGTLHTICLVFSIILVIGVHAHSVDIPKFWVVVNLGASVVGILYYVIKSIVVFTIGSETLSYAIATSVMYTLFYGLVFYFLIVVKSYYVECAYAKPYDLAYLSAESHTDADAAV